MTVFAKFGDKIRGERVHAEFRDYTPKPNPKEIKGTDRKEYTLKTTVQCTIMKPLRKIQ